MGYAVQSQPIWQTWTPAPTGITTPTILSARFIKNGKVVHFRLRMSAGTGSATTRTFTLPVAAAAGADQLISVIFVLNNNVVSQNGPICILTAGTTTANVLRDVGSTAWTASGTSYYSLFGTYETD